MSTCLVLLVDPRITKVTKATTTNTNTTMSSSPSSVQEAIQRLNKKTALTPADDETAVQLVRAINVISLKAAAGMSPVMALLSLTTLLTESIVCTVPMLVAKPCSKLLQRVLGEEIAVLPSEVSGLPGPFQSSASDTAALLLALHQLFMSVSQAKLSTDQESAVGCAKTVLTEIVKHLGEKRVLAALAVQGAIADCATVKLVSKLATLQVNTPPKISPEESAMVHKQSTPVMERAMALADTVAAAREKAPAVRLLWTLMQKNPELEVSTCVRHLGAPHRRYVHMYRYLHLCLQICLLLCLCLTH
jgi:hypothetical protein